LKKEGPYFSKWWVRTIRERNYFGFRYWWFNWLLMVTCILLFIWGTKHLNSKESKVCRADFSNKTDSIYRDLSLCCECRADSILPPPPPKDTIVPPPPVKDSIPEKIEKPPKKDTRPKPPKKNCRVHFSGLVMAGYFDGDVGISKIYEEDYASEYVGSGEYPSNSVAFPKAVSTTFDGIAIDKGTRLIMYSLPNFQGTVLLDVTGPAIINNGEWKNNSNYAHCNSDVYPGNLQSNFPPSVRRWSSSDMRAWSTGSCKIECSE